VKWTPKAGPVFPGIKLWFGVWKWGFGMGL
jgi:hypothetical protein